MTDDPALDHQIVFSGLRNALALVSTRGDAPRWSAMSGGFCAAIGLNQGHLGHPVVPLLPPDWRQAIGFAIGACMGARRSKRVKDLRRPGDASVRCEVDVYRAEGAGMDGHVVLSLEDLDPAAWFADPRVVSLCPQIQTNSAALVYESDVRAARSRYHDNGLIELLGLPHGGQTFDEFRNCIHPDDNPQLDRFWAARPFLADNEINSLTVRMKAVTGEWRLVTLRARVLRRDRSGAPRRMLGVVIDVTDHNALAAALSEADVAAARAGDEERLRIRGELHDSTAQHLLAISLGVHYLERVIPHTATIDEALQDIRTSIGEAQREIQMFSFLLHPPAMPEAGIAAALDSFCSGFARRTGLGVEFEALGEPKAVAAEIEATIYKVAQEAAMHAFRQAGVTALRMRLLWRSQTVALEISDTRPTADTAVEDAFLAQDEVALQGMQSRMARVEGTLERHATNDRFSIVAEAPLRGRSVASGAP